VGLCSNREFACAVGEEICRAAGQVAATDWQHVARPPWWRWSRSPPLASDAAELRRMRGPVFDDVRTEAGPAMLSLGASSIISGRDIDTHHRGEQGPWL